MNRRLFMKLFPVAPLAVPLANRIAPAAASFRVPSRFVGRGHWYRVFYEHFEWSKEALLNERRVKMMMDAMKDWEPIKASLYR